MAINIPESGRKRVVIVGAGFGGLRLARKLQVRKEFQLVLIDRENYHQFQPLFYQVATSGLEPSSISFPLRKVFQKDRNTFVRITSVKRIIPEEKQIETGLGRVWYDYLVIATGATTNFFGNESFEKNGTPMKSVSEAVYLRNSILMNFEKAVSVLEPDLLKRLMSIVVVGGGPTGVEICGALAEMRRFVLPKDYPDLDFRLMQITLVESGDRLLHTMSSNSSSKSREYLEKMGINVKLGVQVTDYDGHVALLNSGEKLQTETLIWAAGIRGQIPDGVDPNLVARGNRLLVNRYNQLEGFDSIFAIGDVALMKTDKYPNGHPQVAQVALQQASQLQKNLIALKYGRTMKQFEYHDKGSMATVGRNRAVVDLPFMKFSGPIAWIIWMFIHLMSIVGVRNRLIIFVNWLWRYFTFDQSLRLMLKPSRKAKERPIG